MKSAGDLQDAGALPLRKQGSGVVSPAPALAMPSSPTGTKSPADGRTVKLRDHPLMTRKTGTVIWPPQWQCVGPDRRVVQGELGVLEDVSMHDLIENKIFMAMAHMSERYITVLGFDDGILTKQLYSLLVQQIGHSIREIGDLNLPTYFRPFPYLTVSSIHYVGCY